MKLSRALWLLGAAYTAVLTTACHHRPTPNTPPTRQFTAASSASEIAITKSPNDDRLYAAQTLPNGLQVVVVSDPNLENAAASLAVGVGSAADPKSQPGLAHYLEHMLFLGTQKYPTPDSFFKFVEANAGYANAFTAFDQTNFHFQVNTTKFDEALDQFSDYFKAPTLDAQYADKERNAVNAEWSGNAGQDNWIINALDGLTANPANPKAQFNIGNLTTLIDKPNSTLQTEVKNFYQHFYSANNMRLTLVGKQSLDELKAMAQRHFAGIGNKNIARPVVTTPGFTAAQYGQWVSYQPIKDLRKIFVDFPIADNKNQWQVKPNEFVLNLLTSEEEGTLGEQLRKTGLSNNVTAHVNPDAFGPDGYLRIEADLTDKGLQNSDQVIASILAYVELVKKRGANEIYFRELKAMRAKDFTNAPKPDPLHQAVTLSADQFDLPLSHILDADYIYDHFDANAIGQLLAQLDRQKIRVWTINKQVAADKPIPYFKGQYNVRPIADSDFQRWAHLAEGLTFNLPPPNTLFTDLPAAIVANDLVRPKVILSQPGIEAFLAQPEFYREDKGVITLEINNAIAQNSAANIVLSNILSDVFNAQSTTLIDRAARASLSININPSPTNSQAITLSGYTAKHGDLLRQLLASYAHLTISEKDFSEALVRYKQFKSNAKKAPPVKQAFGHASRLLSAKSWTDEQLLAAAEQTRLPQLIAYHRAVVTQPLIRLFAFGNYTPAAVAQMAGDAQQQLPSTLAPEKRRLKRYLTPKPGNVLTFNASSEQNDNALVTIYLRDKASIKEQVALEVLNSITQNAFFSQLRTEEQLGYVVGTGEVPVDDYAGFSFYVQSTNTELPALKARFDKFRQEFLPQLQAIDPAQIEQFKAALSASLLQKPTDFYQESKRYLDDFWTAHYQFDKRERQLAALNQVDKAGLIELYQKLLTGNRQQQIIIQLKGAHFAKGAFAK